MRVGQAQDVREDLLEDIFPFEAAPIGQADCRMIGHLLINPEPKGPMVGEVCLDLFNILADGADDLPCYPVFGYSGTQRRCTIEKSMWRSCETSWSKVVCV